MQRLPYMELNDLKREYAKLNKSFDKKLVFRMGADAGFFSEYNNMLLAIHYCLVNSITFVLSSKNANFSSTKCGWTDYFEKFTKEYKFPLLSVYNKRMESPVFKNKKDEMIFSAYRKIKGINFITYELFREIRRQDVNKVYSIPRVELNGTLLENCSKIHNLIWNYNNKTREEIEIIKEKLSLSGSYYAFHIRGGDKLIEHDLYSFEAYMNCVSQNKSIENIFVLTDDYTNIELLIKHYPCYNFKTLCNEHERGYIHQEFEKKTKSEKRKDLLKLFASMDLMQNAEMFVGTFSSNPGMNMGFRMPKDKIVGLDFSEWVIW